MNEKNYGLVESETQLEKLVDKLLADNTTIAIDVETGYYGPPREKAALHPEESFIVGISFTNSTNWARYVPVRHDEGENFSSEFVARQFWRLLQSGQAIAHQMKFEQRQLSKFFRDNLWNDPDYGKAVQESKGYFPYKSCTLMEAYVTADRQYIGLKDLAESK